MNILYTFGLVLILGLCAVALGWIVADLAKSQAIKTAHLVYFFFGSAVIAVFLFLLTSCTPY